MDHLKSLFEKYVQNEITPQEITELLDGFAVDNIAEALEQGIDETLSSEVKDTEELSRLADEVYRRIQLQINAETNPETRKFKWKARNWFAVAASLVILLSTVLYLYNRKPGLVLKNHYANDIAPGKNKAILTLADGKKIELNDTAAADLSTSQGIRITKTKMGSLVYQATGTQGTQTGSPAYNTAETPKGGQYIINLADGTKVILNAASSLKFPVNFKGLNRRRVELTGEAYFEVSKDHLHPFVVISGKQEIEVLGTHFNVQAYAEEELSKTTLLEGSVRVNGQAVLKPGEQCINNGTGRLQLKKVDTEAAVAWKNGDFQFEDENLDDIVRSISRWYNVEFVFTNQQLRKLRFSGTVSRYAHVSEILDILELSKDVHFKVEGRRITVTK